MQMTLIPRPFRDIAAEAAYHGYFGSVMKQPKAGSPYDSLHKSLGLSLRVPGPIVIKTVARISIAAFGALLLLKIQLAALPVAFVGVLLSLPAMVFGVSYAASCIGTAYLIKAIITANLTLLPYAMGASGIACVLSEYYDIIPFGIVEHMISKMEKDRAIAVVRSFIPAGNPQPA